MEKEQEKILSVYFNELKNTYKSAQHVLTRFIADLIIGKKLHIEFYSVECEGYLCGIRAKFEGIKVDWSIAPTYICYHNINGIAFEMDEEFEKFFIENVLKMHKEQRKNQLECKINELEKELKDLQ